MLLDLIDELIAELDVTCTDANILTKSEAKNAISVLFELFKYQDCNLNSSFFEM